MAIPLKIARKLSDPVWKRPHQEGLENGFLELGIPTSDPFREFYSTFQGPFGSDNIGYELLDVIDQKESIVSNTRVVRKEFKFPPRYIVLTAMIGHAVLVYDFETGAVFDVDFEGGDRLLLDGQLTPRWHSWWEFVKEFII